MYHETKNNANILFMLRQSTNDSYDSYILVFTMCL